MQNLKISLANAGVYHPTSLAGRLVNVLGERLHDAVPGNVIHSGGDLPEEPLVVAQVIPEQALDAEQLGRVVASGASLGLELLAHGVDHLERLATVVDPLDVVEPGGGDEAQAAERTRLPDRLGNRGHDELRNLAGRVETDTGQLVHDGGVGKALDEGVAILVDVDARDLRQERLDLLLHHLPHELAEQRVRHDLVHVLEARQLTGVAQGRVAAVEQAQLVLLELLDSVHILDHLDPNLLEGRTAVGELILDDPLREGLRDDGPRVHNAKLLCQCRFVGLRRLRGDAIDHGVREGAFLGNPLRDLRVAQAGKRLEHVAGDGSVLLHVVAGHDGEGLETLLVAAGQARVEETEGRARGLLVGRVQVELDVRVLTLQLVGVLIVVVTALGDGEGHNLRVRVSHLGDDRLAVIGGKEVGVDAADDVGKAALGRTLNEGVEVVLRGQRVAHGRVEGLQAHSANGVVVYPMLLHQLVDVDSQVRPVETADTNVDDSLLDGATALVGRDLHQRATCRCDLRQVPAIELERCHCVQIGGGGREMNDKGEIEKGEEKAAGPLLLWTAGSQEGMQEHRNTGTQKAEGGFDSLLSVRTSWAGLQIGASGGGELTHPRHCCPDKVSGVPPVLDRETGEDQRDFKVPCIRNQGVASL